MVDGILVEFNGTAETPELFHGHTHFWHEQPLCAANWYVQHLGLTLPPLPVCPLWYACCRCVPDSLLYAGAGAGWC